MRGGSFLVSVLRGIVRAALLLGFAAGVVVLMLWLAGKFSPKVPSGGSGRPVHGAGSRGSRGACAIDPPASLGIGRRHDSCRA